MSSLPELVERLATLTEQHVHAAYSLDASQVSAIAQQRADLQFELKVRLQTPPELDEPSKTRTRAAAERLARAEHRFERIVGHVLGALSSWRSTPAPIYGRTGRIGK